MVSESVLIGSYPKRVTRQFAPMDLMIHYGDEWSGQGIEMSFNLLSIEHEPERKTLESMYTKAVYQRVHVILSTDTWRLNNTNTLCRLIVGA